MINHARTLLLNIAPRANHITADTAAEYVPADFFPVNLTNELRLLRRVLFGSKPDARFINLRIRELMGYVHQTEAAHYVYDLDPRVTYWPTAYSDFESAARNQVNVTQIFGPPQRLPIIGTFNAEPATGTSMHQYVLAAGIRPPAPQNTMPLVSEDTTNTALAIQQLNTTTEPQIFTIGNIGDTSVATLPDTQLKIALNFAEDPSLYAELLTEMDGFLLHESYAGDGTILSEQPYLLMPLLDSEFETVLARWFITVRAAPSPIITSLLPTLEILGEPVFLSLFGVTDVEPYATFKNMWFDHYSPVYRLAGLTLAIIYRTEELRRK